MGINNIMSQMEHNKEIIWSCFEAYNNNDETIFDDMTSSDYLDPCLSAFVGSPVRGVAGAKCELKSSLDKLEDFHYGVDE
jgi:hypothetical protein